MYPAGTDRGFCRDCCDIIYIEGARPKRYRTLPCDRCRWNADKMMRPWIETCRTFALKPTKTTFRTGLYENLSKIKFEGKRPDVPGITVDRTVAFLQAIGPQTSAMIDAMENLFGMLLELFPLRSKKIYCRRRTERIVSGGVDTLPDIID